MPLPGDIPYVTLTYGAHINSANKNLISGKMYVTPQLARTHIGSGTYVDRSQITTRIVAGVGTSAPVIASDAPGFNVDGLVLYTIEFQDLKSPDGSQLTRAPLLNVALPLAVPVVDVDLLASAEHESGEIVYFPSVISVAGESGVITTEELLEALPQKAL